MINIKSWIIMIILICVYTIFCAYSYVQAVSSDLKESVFRLHVIANSDSEEDQNLKYKVRDNLLKYMNDICSTCTTKAEAIEIAETHLDDFKQIAESTILNNGYSYDVNVELGEFEFPTKSYGSISFPAGIYDALKVKIGNAEGHNWWCVMFPPLCFVDISNGVIPEDSKKVLENELTQEEFALISDDSSSAINLKFKLLEIFSNSEMFTARN